MEFVEFDEFQISLKLYFFFCSSLIILNFLPEKRHIEPPYNKAEIWKFCMELMAFNEFHISLKFYSPMTSYWIILNFLPEKLGYSTTLLQSQNDHCRFYTIECTVKCFSTALSVQQVSLYYCVCFVYFGDISLLAGWVV